MRLCFPLPVAFEAVVPWLIVEYEEDSIRQSMEKGVCSSSSSEQIIDVMSKCSPLNIIESGYRIDDVRIDVELTRGMNTLDRYLQSDKGFFTRFNERIQGQLIKDGCRVQKVDGNPYCEFSRFAAYGGIFENGVITHIDGAS